MTGFCAVSANDDVNSLVETCGYATAALTVLPIPGSEILAVMPLHVGMVVGIANHHGRSITQESATELLMQIGTTVGVSLVGSRVATTAAKILLPGLGGIVAAPFMFASTLAIGAVADGWFARNGSMSSDEMKAVYNSTLRNAKGDFNRDKMREAAEAEAATPEDPLERLKRAKAMHTEGLIDDDEFTAVKDRILGAL